MVTEQLAGAVLTRTQLSPTLLNPCPPEKSETPTVHTAQGGGECLGLISSSPVSMGRPWAGGHPSTLGLQTQGDTRSALSTGAPGPQVSVALTVPLLPVPVPLLSVQL